jgi:charged multivesicular body protein 4
LTAELEELEQEVLDSQLLGADAPPVTVPNVPNVPTSEPGMKLKFFILFYFFYFCY